MRPFFLVALVAAITTHFSLAVETQHAATTVVVYVTVPRSSSPSHTAAVVVQQASNGETDETDAQSTDLQSPSSEASSTTTSGLSRAPEIKSQPTYSDASSSYATSSQATSSQDYPKVTQAPNIAEPDYSEPGASSMGGGAIDTDGGASGSSTAAFHLSKGGLAAILVVVILVAIFGSEYSLSHLLKTTKLTRIQSQAQSYSSSQNASNGQCEKLSHVARAGSLDVSVSLRLL